MADALSRAPVDKSENVHLMSISATLPLKEERFEEIRRETEKDNILCNPRKVISEGWPEHKSQLHHDLSQHFSYRDEIPIENWTIFKGERVLIPESLRNSMKKKIHEGHTGINS